MRILFTLCLLQLSVSCFPQGNINNLPLDSTQTFSSYKRYSQPCGLVRRYATNSDTSKINIIIRCGSLSNNCNPLLIVDGISRDYSKGISDINPSNIDSIFILKGSTALTLYGSAGVNGIIIITTKKFKQRTFIIKDFTGGYAIPGATVSFISADKKDTITTAANDSGVVSINKLKIFSSYEMKVSSSGFHAFSQSITTTNNFFENSIYFERFPKICEPVILRVTQCHRISCTLYCGISGMTVKYMASPKLNSTSQSLSLTVFPNPVQRGGTINLQLNNDGKEKSIRLTSLDGKQLMQKPIPISKCNTVFPLLIDSRWASGIYFLQVICEKGRVLASDKIIIQ